MDNNLYQQFLGAIANIVTILLPLGGVFYGFYKAKGVEFVKSKIALIKDDKTRKLVNDAFDRVEKLIDTEISNAESVAKPMIIEDILKGKVDRDSLKELGTTVAQTVISQLNEQKVDLLKTEINDVEAYINSKIEERLGVLKLDPASPVSKTTLPEVITPVVDTTELENKNTQLQADKDNLAVQISNLQSNFDSVTQIKDGLVVERDDLKKQVTDLQEKLNSISSVVSQVQ